MSPADLMEKVVSLAKRRGFVFPGSEIYGGLANSWDYGPLGVELKNNIKREWWRRFVESRADVVGLETAIMMNTDVWNSSGHLEEFADMLAECKKCKGRYRVDEIDASLPSAVAPRNDGADVSLRTAKGEAISRNDGDEEIASAVARRSSRNDERRRLSRSRESLAMTGGASSLRGSGGATEAISCPSCGAKLSEPRKFNTMFKTFMGPVEDSASIVYLRPETAQGMFVNFENVINSTRSRLPFGIAQIGKSFRNEITPGNFIFRTREFEQMEIEYFIRERDWKKYFEKWLKEMKRWLKDLGIKNSHIEYVEVSKKERAHYSDRTVDIFYNFPFGSEELYGLAYRGNFDLKNHKQVYTEPKSGEKFIPHTIEPTWGVERTLLALLVEHYKEEKIKGENRTVLKLPYWLAPYKVAVLPLSKKAPLTRLAKRIHKELLPYLPCDYDETQSIGKRYRRQDEIGTPYCITVDFDSPKKKDVTVRERDTMKQERVKIDKLADYLKR